MKSSNAYLTAIRIAGVCGALAASIAAPSHAAPALGEPEAQAQHATPAPAHELNLPGLEQRVRDTKAISVLQKLALQQQVDELLARFRHAHSGGRADLVALRRPYDRLLGSIESLLSRDPQLASEVSASREAIWEVLSNRAKFASL